VLNFHNRRAMTCGLCKICNYFAWKAKLLTVLPFRQ